MTASSLKSADEFPVADQIRKRCGVRWHAFGGPLEPSNRVPGRIDIDAELVN